MRITKRTKDTFTATELCALLNRIQSLPHRQAILFALETNLPPSAVMTISHKKAASLRLSALADAIVRSVPRHLRLDYVFWEFLNPTVAVPLFKIEQEFLRFSEGVPFEKFRQRYNGMVWVDTLADAAELQQYLG